MAIIPVQRPFLLGGQYLQQSLRTRLPVTFTTTAYPGDLLSFNNAALGTQVTVNNTATGTGSTTDGANLAGICEQYLVPAAAGDPITATLLMPFILYEVTALSTVTWSQAASIGKSFAPQAITSFTGTNIGGTGKLLGFALASTTSVQSVGPFIVVAAKGYEDQYITHTVFQAAGTAAAAGATHVPSVDAGTNGDQNPRVIVVVPPAFTRWGSIA